METNIVAMKNMHKLCPKQVVDLTMKAIHPPHKPEGLYVEYNEDLILRGNCVKLCAG